MQAPPPPPGFVINSPAAGSAPSGGLTRITPPKAPKVVDPYDANQDAIKNANEAERLRMAREREAREREDYERKKALGPEGEATVDERKAAGFLKRALNAESNFLNIDADPDAVGQQQIGGRSLPGLAFAETFPNAANAFSSESRQLADQAQREFIAAILRYDSGAAIPPSEFVTNAQIYFPSPGDTPAVIAQKAEARRTAIEGLRSSSGRAAPQSVSTPEGMRDVAQFAIGAAAPGVDGVVVDPGAPPTGTSDERNAADDSTLEPGQQFAYDAQGNRIGILNADGSWNSGFGSIVDDFSAREAEEKIKNALGDDRISMTPGIEKGASWNWSDEYRGLQGGLRSLVTEGDFGKGYRENRDLERAAQRLSRKEHGILPELGGSLATAVIPMGAAATTGQLIKQGAAIGAAAGAGEGEGFRDTALKTTVGSGIGALTGAGIAQVPKLAKALGRNRPLPDRSVIDAGKRQGIPIRLPDAMPSRSREFAVLESSPNQGQRIADTLAADVEAFGNRVAGVVPGRPLEPLPRGDMIQKAGGRYLARTRQKATELYDAAKAAGGDEIVDAAPFVQDVDNRIAQLKANGEEANSGVISMLESMKRDLASGISVPKLQAQRTTLRSRLNQAGLTMDPNQAQLSDALSVASDVLKGGLSKPGAKEALSAADAFYADRQKFIGGVLKHFSDRKGNIGPETAAKRFDQFLKEGGNFRVVQKMFGELEPDEKSSIAASVAQSLGRNQKGEFSLPIFLNNVSGKSATLSNRAQFLLFGKEGVRALRDLEVIAKAKTASEGSFNRSRSATTFQGGFRLKDSLMSLLGVGGAATAGGDTLPVLATGALAYGASRGVSKISDARKANLFLNPKFTTWLRNAPDSDDPAVIGKYLDRLNKIASRDQAFLMDANAIRDYVTSALLQSPSRAAATGQQEENGR